MFKKFIILALCSISVYNVRGQAIFNHAIGLSLYGYDGVPGLMYSPRWNIKKWNENSTLSIGTHFGINYGIYGGGVYVRDIPIMLELNLGHGSHSKNEKNSGQFIGLGYGFSELDEIGTSEGIVFNAGLRQNLDGQSLGIRVSYLLSLRPIGRDIVSIGLFYTFKHDTFSGIKETTEKVETVKPMYRKRSLLETVLGL
jgi:hypothetical protein